MTLLLFYVALALGVSFLCSVAEAVLLSITPAHLELSAQQGRKSGALLKQMKADINSPLAAILTLNTCLLYTSPSPRDRTRSRMPSSA